MDYINLEILTKIMRQSYRKLAKYSVLNKDEINKASETFGVDKLYVMLCAVSVDSKEKCFGCLYYMSEINYGEEKLDEKELFNYYFRSVMTMLIHTYINKVLRIASCCGDFNIDKDSCLKCPIAPINTIPIIVKIMETENIDLDPAIMKYQQILRGNNGYSLVNE